MTQKLQGGLKGVWPKIRDGESQTSNLEGINSYSLTEKKLSGVVDRKIFFYHNQVEICWLEGLDTSVSGERLA